MAAARRWRNGGENEQKVLVVNGRRVCHAVISKERYKMSQRRTIASYSTRHHNAVMTLHMAVNSHATIQQRPAR